MTIEELREEFKLKNKCGLGTMLELHDYIEHLESKLIEKENAVCGWKQIKRTERHDIYFTDCKRRFLDDGKNLLEYCPYCKGKIEVKE